VRGPTETSSMVVEQVSKELTLELVATRASSTPLCLDRLY